MMKVFYTQTGDFGILYFQKDVVFFSRISSTSRSAPHLSTMQKLALFIAFSLIGCATAFHMMKTPLARTKPLAMAPATEAIAMRTLKNCLVPLSMI
jgi:hypothetical protein